MSPTIARCCNPSTVVGAYRLSPALFRARTVKRGVDRCPDILGVGTQYSLRGFGRDIKTSPNRPGGLASFDRRTSIHLPLLCRGTSSPVPTPRANHERLRGIVASRLPQTGGLNRVDRSVRRRSGPFIVGHHTLTPPASERCRPFTVVPVTMNLLSSYSGQTSLLPSFSGQTSSLPSCLGLVKQFTVILRTCDYGVVGEFASASVFVMCCNIACARSNFPVLSRKSISVSWTSAPRPAWLRDLALCSLLVSQDVSVVRQQASCPRWKSGAFLHTHF